jgi:hypothetical protein
MPRRSFALRALCCTGGSSVILFRQTSISTPFNRSGVPPLAVDVGAPDGRWRHRDWRHGPPGHHSARRTGFPAGVLRRSAGSDGVRRRDDRWWRRAAPNGASPLRRDRRKVPPQPGIRRRTIYSLRIRCTPGPLLPPAYRRRAGPAPLFRCRKLRFGRLLKRTARARMQPIAGPNARPDGGHERGI